MKRDLLSIDALSTQDIDGLIAQAVELKQRQRAGLRYHPLTGRTLGLLFEKPSTRTRVSFEVAMIQLGGHALYMSSRDTQLSRQESPEDTARVLSRYLDGIVIRTFSQDTLEIYARYATIPVISGLTDLLHPCQILSDLMTIVEKRGGYRHLLIAYVGDGNNVANTWIDASLKLGFRLHLACPEGYAPDGKIMARARAEAPERIRLYNDPVAAVQGADIVNTDTWISMGQEEDHARRRAAFKNYQVNSTLLAAAHKEVLVMHCLPAHRGEEITDEVADGKHAVIFDQAENRLHMQKAVLATFLTCPPEES